MRNWGRTAEGEGVALTWDLAGLRGETAWMMTDGAVSSLGGAKIVLECAARG